MVASRSTKQSLRRFFAVGFLAGLTWVGCSPDSSDPTIPSDQIEVLQDLLGPAMAVQERHTPELMARAEVVGTAVGLSDNGEPVVRIYTAARGVEGLPERLDGFPVEVEVTGLFVARQDPTGEFPRPVPTGVSTGHPDITAGTICCRVSNNEGEVFALSNNHVYANENQAQLDDPVLQPGAFDGGTVPDDEIGELADYEPILFCTNSGRGGLQCPDNEMDAAIALTSTALVGAATPANGYGSPTSSTVAAFVGQDVKKYGRTTVLTFGQVNAINATVNVSYGASGVARFVGQIIITPGSFSAGGDSGSLIVDEDNNPLGLLFAGSALNTIANPIVPVLNRFGVTINSDGSPPPPPPPPPSDTDISIAAVNGPQSAEEGTTLTIAVTVSNVGDQDVNAPIAVTLTDETDVELIGTQTIQSRAGFPSGASTTLSFSWNTTGASIGDHTITAAHGFDDDNADNNSASTVVGITEGEPPPPASGMHIGDLDQTSADQGRGWSAFVTVTVHDASHNPLPNATVVGSWVGERGSVECSTDSAGECVISRTSLTGSSTTFIVSNVTHATSTYEPANNHDPDGDSDGTSITVPSPN